MYVVACGRLHAPASDDECSSLLIAARLYNALNCKSLVESTVAQLVGRRIGAQKRRTKNPALRWTMGITILLSLAAVYAPGFRVPFGMVPLDLADLAAASAIPSLVLVVGEILKAVRHPKEHRRPSDDVLEPGIGV
jgi:hypothetical protein